MIEAIISLSFFNLYAATPQRPWYSETSSPRHIANNDRLTAEYFNNQLNVIYNWAQRTNTELDNLLHNGIGVASLTVGILNCTNKIINPEWDNLLHNGIGVASITVGLVKTQDLEISNKIDVPAIEFSGRSQPTPPVNNGMLYFDSDLQRFRVYQEDGWRDLSSNYIIDGTTLTNPLIIDGYLDTKNIYVNNNASVSKNLYVGENINSSGTAVLESVKVKHIEAQNASVTNDIYALNLDLGWGSTITQYGAADNLITDNKASLFYNRPPNLNLGFRYRDPSDNSIHRKYLITKDEAVSNITTGDTDGTIKFYRGEYSSGVIKVKGLGSAAYTASTDYATSNHNHDSSYVSAVTQGSSNGTIAVTKNGSTSDVAVKGLGSAAYTASTDYAAANHNHDNTYAQKNHTHTYDSELNDTSTNAVQNKKIKAYIDSHSGGSGIASLTNQLSNLTLYKLTSPTPTGPNCDISWTATAYSSDNGEVELYEVSENYCILRISCGFTNGGCNSGTYGVKFTSSTIGDVLFGKRICSMYVTSYNSNADVGNGRIVFDRVNEPNTRYYAFDLKTNLDTGVGDIILLYIHYRKFSDS